jgi:hypothetical protein
VSRSGRCRHGEGATRRADLAQECGCGSKSPGMSQQRFIPMKLNLCSYPRFTPLFHTPVPYLVSYPCCIPVPHHCFVLYRSVFAAPVSYPCFMPLFHTLFHTCFIGWGARQVVLSHNHLGSPSPGAAGAPEYAGRGPSRLRRRGVRTAQRSLCPRHNSLACGDARLAQRLPV